MLEIMVGELLESQCSCLTAHYLDPQKCPSMWHTFRQYSSKCKPMRAAICWTSRDNNTLRIRFPTLRSRAEGVCILEESGLSTADSEEGEKYLLVDMISSLSSAQEEAVRHVLQCLYWRKPIAQTWVSNLA